MSGPRVRSSRVRPPELAHLSSLPGVQKTTAPARPTATAKQAKKLLGTIVRPDAIAARTPNAIDRDPLRACVYVNGRLRFVPFAEALVARAEAPPGKYTAVTAKQIDAAMTRAKRERMSALQDLANAPARATIAPEDGSADVAAYHMSFGQFDQSMERFIEQMASVGRVEGFRVVVRAHPEQVEDLTARVDRVERRNTTFVASECFGDIWSEDAGEMRSDRSVMIGHCPSGQLDLDAIIFGDRQRRFGPKNKAQTQFSRLGMSYAEDRDAQRGMAAIALASGKPVDISFSCIEGGNALVGRHADGRPYVLVGRDSVALTRAVLSSELGREVDEDFVRLAIGKDYGVATADVVFVEQPADYHLDVKMMLVAPGEVVVNDALLAHELLEQWTLAEHAKNEPRANASAERKKEWRDDGKRFKRELLESRMQAVREAKIEGKAVRDLESAGLVVHRIGGKFPWSRIGAPMNFLNTEQGRGRDGERFLVALGGDRRAEKHFVETMAKISGGAIKRYYLLDREQTGSTLQAGGGIACRAKIEVA